MTSWKTIDKYFEEKLMTEYGLSKDDHWALNYRKRQWNGSSKVFYIQELSKSRKSMKCKVFDLDTNKTREYKMYSVEKFLESLLEEHKNTSSIGVEPDDW